jgi:hypothetical protein
MSLTKLAQDPDVQNPVLITKENKSKQKIPDVWGKAKTEFEETIRKHSQGYPK